MYQAFQRTKIKNNATLVKIVFKSAQIELAVDSTLNKHIDEIIYFFEATEKSIVIIEDLDRFNSINLFSKLREVNFLINNSPLVGQAVTFIYAIRDDIFKDNINRLKFFDFILPIVPVINTTNSGDQLRKMLGRESDPDSNYINDISIYIHDFRLLKNIVNEYQVYRGIINQNNNKKNEFIFSIILYKNLFPTEFSLEQSEEGLLFKIFHQKKKKVIDSLTENYMKLLNDYEIRKTEVLSEEIESEIKLREEYLIEILKSKNNVLSICNRTVNELSSNEVSFENLLDNPQIQRFNESNRPVSERIDFNAIQKKVNPSKSYEERVKLIKDKINGKLKEIEKEIERNTIEVENVKRMKLSLLIKIFKDNIWENLLFEDKAENLLKEYRLLTLLIRKGYIDENYQLCMSHFYEGALNLADFSFLLNVKSNEGENFDNELTNLKEIVSRISYDEFEYNSALNKYLIVYLLEKPGNKEDIRLQLLLKQLDKIKESFKNYILPLISLLKDNQVLLQRFIDLLATINQTIWRDIVENSVDQVNKDDLLKLFLDISEEKLQKINSDSDDSLRSYLLTKTDFISVFTSIDETNTIKLIKSLDLKFKNLEFKDYEGNPIFNYIYKNSCYELNEEMLFLMLFHKMKLDKTQFENLFNNQNYTCIFSSESDELDEYIFSNFETYINDIYLHIESKQNESEDAFLSLIESYEGENDKEVLNKILAKNSTQIVDLVRFGKNELWSQLFESENVEPNWSNLFNYFNLTQEVLNESIIKWLNIEGTYLNITKQWLKYENFPNEKTVTVTLLMTGIIENDKLLIEGYEKLINSFHYVFPKIDINNISRSKVLLLVKCRTLKFNLFHFDQLFALELFTELLLFTIYNYANFIAEYSEFKFSLNLHKGLLKSSNLTTNNKIALISLITIDNIKDSELACEIGNLLLSSRKPFIGNEKILQVIKICKVEDIKLKLFDKYFTEFNIDELTNILDYLGGSYRKAGVLRKRPVWKKNKLNLSIAQKLYDVGFFRSIDLNKKDKIKIVVRYQ